MESVLSTVGVPPEQGLGRFQELARCDLQPSSLDHPKGVAAQCDGQDIRRRASVRAARPRLGVRGEAHAEQKEAGRGGCPLQRTSNGQEPQPLTHSDGSGEAFPLGDRVGEAHPNGDDRPAQQRLGDRRPGQEGLNDQVSPDA